MPALLPLSALLSQVLVAHTIELDNEFERRLAESLRPHAEGWRATAPYLARTDAQLANPREALPHYPLVLHRGGWPDGS